jgi:transcriptional regulator with XRE-family HTH domain
VSGLRREEVALLAGISPDYYLRLERGRDKTPSPQVLESLARVLQLDDVERTYLLGLATARLKSPRRKRPEHVPPRAHELLAHLQIPAFVEGRAFDVLASNPLAVALSPRLRPGLNRLRSLLLDPEEQAFHQDWNKATADFIAALRTTIGDDIDNPRFVELVGELALSSQRFRTLWVRHDVRSLDEPGVATAVPAGAERQGERGRGGERGGREDQTHGGVSSPREVRWRAPC